MVEFWGVFGIILSFTFSASTALGLSLQKVVYEKRNNNPKSPQLHKHKLYVVGVALVLIGSSCKIISYGILPLTTYAPLSALTVVFTQFFEIIFSDQTISSSLVICILLTWSGISMAVMNTNVNDPEYSLHLIIKLFFREDLVFYTVLILLSMFSTKLTLNIAAFQNRNIIGLLYLSAISGVCAGWSSTIAKAVVEIVLHARFHDISELGEVGAWLFLLSMPLLTVSKAQVVQQGLLEYHHLLFLPFYQAFAILFTGLFGALYYDEFSPNRSTGTDKEGNVPLYCIGLLVTCIGVAGFAFKYDPQEHSKATAALLPVIFLGLWFGFYLVSCFLCPGSEEERSLLLHMNDHSKSSAGAQKLLHSTYSSYDDSDGGRRSLDFDEEGCGGDGIEYVEEEDEEGASYGGRIGTAGIGDTHKSVPSPGYLMMDPAPNTVDILNVMPILSSTQTSTIQSYFANTLSSSLKLGENSTSSDLQPVHTRFASSPAYPKSYIGNWAAAGAPVKSTSSFTNSTFAMTPNASGSNKSKALFSGSLDVTILPADSTCESGYQSLPTPSNGRTPPPDIE